MDAEPRTQPEPQLEVLSHHQAKELLAARGKSEVVGSVDLGVRRLRLALSAEGVTFPSARLVAWEQLQKVADSDSVCFRLDGAELLPIREFSSEFSKTFSLYPTETSPAMLISGFVMHRIKEISPSEGAKKMVRALGRLRGRVLDTATGLGYAAIEASKSAEEVVSVELDPTARLMCRQNPWSAELFTRSNIRLLLGGSEKLIETFKEGSFSAVLHDPPALSIAGDLYSLAFYQNAHRVLARGGRMFHYIGDPKSQSGSRTTSGTIRRLYEAGFRKVTQEPDAFGVLALK